jgi:hypothetical protein
MKAKFNKETHIEVSDFWKRVRLDISTDQLLALEDWQDFYETYILGVVKRPGQVPILAMVSPIPGLRMVVPIEIIAESLGHTALTFTPGGSLELVGQDLFPVGPIAMDFLKQNRPRVWLAAPRSELKKAWLAFLNELQIAAMKSGGCCEFLSYREYENAVGRAAKACAEGRYAGDAWLFIESMAFENNYKLEGEVIK